MLTEINEGFLTGSIAIVNNNMNESNNPVFYRKYRPRKFEEVVGQEQVVLVLKNAILKKRVAHAYLFSGPRGTGKTTVARILAREVGCFDEDIIEIDAASSRGIDEARALREAVRVLPLRSPYKVYIIDEVHMLTKEAFNALLKTIEEPPEHTIFVMATTETEKVPDTIISRSQHFKFSRIGIPDIVRELAKIAKAEGFSADDDALKLIAFFADGSLRDAENILLQALSLDGKKVAEADIRLILGAPEEESVNKIMEFSLKKDVSGALKIFDETLGQGTDPAVLGRLLLRNFRAIYFLALDPRSSSLLEKEFSADEISYLKSFVSSGPQVLEYAVRLLLDAVRFKGDDFISAFPLEFALIKIATFGK